MPHGLDEMLKAQEVADLFRVHVKTIKRWVREGKLGKPVYIARNAPRWYVYDVKALQKRLQEDSAAKAPKEEK